MVVFVVVNMAMIVMIVFVMIMVGGRPSMFGYPTSVSGVAP